MRRHLRTATARVGAVAIAVATIGLTAPAAHADTTPVELPPLVAAGPNFNQDLRTEVNYWTLAQMASVGLNDDGQDATEPASGWDDLSAPWSTQGQGLITKTAGKLFFVQKDVDSGALVPDSCSADVVTSGNQSTVVTAAHCVAVHTPFDLGAPFGMGNTVVTNMVFIPGYNGAALPRGTTSTALPGKDIAPFGVWGATRAWITNTWSNSADFALGHDMAAILVANPDDPRPIAQVTGAQQIGFNQPQNQYEYMFGYPQTNERNWYWSNNNNGTKASNGEPQNLWRGFDGRTLNVTRGQSQPDAVYANDVLNTAQAPGCSGGPWLQNFDPSTGTGVQTGVNSRYQNPSQGPSPLGWLNWLQGPQMEATHFGDEEQAVWQAAQNASL
ncbi:hypothetical protein ABIA35_004885 [Catenulispora sp. MAP12-49]|uniref:trypsin-like serine peptidase n=1 Tax=Catenulispora sp. MAP12-49 TaxID=3156302 RepID=UPI0035117C22